MANKQFYDDRRVGRFSIKMSLFNENPELVKAITRNTMIIFAECDPAAASIVYVGIGTQFRELPPGPGLPGVPEYTWSRDAQAEEEAETKARRVTPAIRIVWTERESISA